MSEQTKTAVLLRDVTAQNRARAVQRLYLVDPPMKDYVGTAHQHVVVSAVDVLGTPETLIFPATAGGAVSGWGELDGSFRGALDHEQALARAGYTVAEKILLREPGSQKSVDG